MNFQYLGIGTALKLIVFSDSSFRNLSDGGTQGRDRIISVGNSGRFSLLAWQSKRVMRVVHNILTGETLAMSHGIENAIFLSTLHSELTTVNVKHPTLITCVTDNHSLVDALKSTKSVTEKIVRFQISSMKELIQTQKVERVL